MMISIIDDDPCVREGLADLVGSFGLVASTFESADDFLRSKQVNNTSCLITDVQMPGLSGLELQRHLIAQGIDTPIIFITAFPNERDRTRALKSGAVTFLGKPFEEKALRDSIDLALRGQLDDNCERS